MIAETARIHPNAKLGKDLIIGEFVVIHENVEIGDGCTIQDHCVLGVKGPRTSEPLRLGPGATIRSHSVIYEHSTIGPRLETGHHVVIRERSIIGENLRIGNFSDIEGDCSIGDFSRFHGYVHIGKGSRIGHFVWVFSFSNAANDPLPPSDLFRPVTLGDGCVVCLGSILMPGCDLGVGAFVTAGSRPSGTVPPGAVVSGAPGRIQFHVSRLLDLDSGLSHPWMTHFRSVYPDHAQSRLDALLEEVMKTRHDYPFARPRNRRR
jgi:acetyltransferase-like isoleucine patch superfamily enzyme